MALINCSECGKEYSDKAPACPNCGCPTSPGGMTPIASPPEKKSYPKKKSSKGSTLILGLLLTLSGFVFVVFVWTALEATLCNAGVDASCDSIISKRGDTDSEDPLWSQERDGFFLIPAVTNQKFWEKANKLEKERAEKEAAKSKKKNLCGMALALQAGHQGEPEGSMELQRDQDLLDRQSH